MNISPDNILYHELIGLSIEVVESTNRSMVGIKGKVLDETRNMLVILDDKCRAVPKDCSSFVFILNGKKVKVDGKLLQFQPENRIQSKFRKKKFR